MSQIYFDLNTLYILWIGTGTESILGQIVFSIFVATFYSLSQCLTPRKYCQSCNQLAVWNLIFKMI